MRIKRYLNVQAIKYIENKLLILVYSCYILLKVNSFIKKFRSYSLLTTKSSKSDAKKIPLGVN